MIDWIGTTQATTAAVAVVSWWIAGAVILAAGALSARRLAHRSAATRHLVRTLAVIAVLALPLAAQLVPPIAVELPAAGPVSGPAAAAGTLPSTPSAAGTSVPVSLGPVDGPAVRVAPIAAAGGAEPAAPERRLGAAHLSVALLAVWLAGVLFLLARSAADRLARRRIVRRSVAIAGGLEDGPDGPGSRPLRPIRLLRSPDAAVPMTWGVLRPVVILPAASESWSPERRRQVLRHELAHVRRLDTLWQSLAELLCALAWIDPLAWSARRALRREAEHACDDAVLAAGVEPAHYAGHLLETARELRGLRNRRLPAAAPEAAVAMARSSKLGDRIAAVLDGDRSRQPVRPWQAACCGLAAGVAVLALSALSPVAAADAAPTPRFTPAPEPAPAPDDGREIHRVHTTDEPKGGYFSAPRFEGRCERGLFTDRTFGSRVNASDGEWKIEILHGRCELEIEIDGEVELRPDGRGIARMGRGARMTIEEDAEVERKLVVTAGPDGRPRYRWSVDGRRAEIDDAARRWFRGVLVEVFRSTGLQARERVAHLLDAGGMPAVLEEIGRIPSDHVAGIYFAETLKQSRLGPEDAVEVLSLAGETLGSDHELAKLMIAVPSDLLAEPSVQRAYVEAARSIGSDHETGRIVRALLERRELSPDTVDRLLEIAGGIGSDHEAGQVLLALVDRFPHGEPLPASFFRVAADIGSDHELGRVLRQVIDDGRTDDATVTAVLRAAEGIGSDHELAGLLIRIAEEVRLDGALRARYLEVAEDVGSRHERRRVLAALGAG